MHRIVKPIAKNTLFMLVSIQNDEYYQEVTKILFMTQ